MSASSKFDLSSGSPDRQLYTSGQRGSYAAASLDRSSSFRESMESPILSSISNMPKSNTAANQGDVLSFLQCLRFDPKSMIGDHKLNRPVDFKRLMAAALGIPQDDSQSASSKGKLQLSPSLEDLRRLRAFLGVSCSKARERTKIFSEASSVIIKCFPSTPSRKRSRLDALSNDRSNTLFPNDRTVSGMGIGKMGVQNHASTSGFELEQQKLEERTKSSIPNKRTRTSMSDIRASTPVRPSLNIEKERETLRLPNSSGGQGEDRTLPIGVDSWEKSKMKKKRSGIKQDVPANLAATKPIEGYREPKQGLQQRQLSDSRPRLADTLGFRPGVANGSVGVGKADGSSVHIGMRASISRADPDNSPLHDRRDRPTGSEKERVNLKAVNKTNAREDFSSGSPTSSTKINATTRAPRSSAGLLTKLPQVSQRATVASDWEISHCTTNKLPVASGVNNRKRSLSARSSSPPVAQWAGQRPQKISRTARRTNFSPIVPNSDEMPTSDAITDVMGTERRLPANSPQQVKLKSESFSSALSESEESGAAETKSKDKNKKTDEMDEKVGVHVQKMSTLLLPPRKNKVVNGEDHGDGIRRQGRTGRTFSSGRSHVSLAVEKLGNAGTAKQLRSSRFGVDKSESKAGRPPTRKLSDRKAYARQKHTTINAPADFLDDGHEELLAATNAVINPAQALSSSMWKEMEPYFRYISDIDLVYMKQQMAPELDISTPAPLTSDVDNTSLVSNGFELSEVGLKGRMPKEIPLYQRLMAALIPEEGNEELCYNGNDTIGLDTFESGFEHEGDMELGNFCSRMLQNSDAFGHTTSNGFRSNATERSYTELGRMMPNNSNMCIPETGMTPKYNQAENGLLSDQAMMPIIVCSVDQYSNMSISERLLLELQSVGICPDEVPDLAQTEDEETTKDISALHEKYQEQVLKKQGLLGKLSKAVYEAKELQEKEFETQALDKLVGMAYEKYMTCWGPNAHGMKSVSGKMAKQAALAFVRRTLERYREFELTGKSCFGESLYTDMFLSGTSRLGDGQPVDSTTDGDSSKLHASNSGCSAEVRASAALGAQHSPSSEVLVSANLAYENNSGREEPWLNKVKKRELSLVDVGGGTVGTSSCSTSGIGSSFAKGKRSERDREGKGSSSRDVSRNSTTKIGRPAAANVKGERKSKAKPKQKTTQLSASNSLLAKKGDHNKANLPSVPKSSEMSSHGIDKDNLEILDDPIDLSGLQLPGMEDLGGPDDFGGQGQDIGSWLNIDDDGLQDHDDYGGGLQIPMDDLSDLNMMV